MLKLDFIAPKDFYISVKHVGQFLCMNDATQIKIPGL